MSPVIEYLPIDNTFVKIIIANIIGAIIFFPIDMWIFSKQNKEVVYE